MEIILLKRLEDLLIRQTVMTAVCMSILATREGINQEEFSKRLEEAKEGIIGRG